MTTPAKVTHTPGPWEFMPGELGSAGFVLNPGIRGADGFYVATVSVDCPDSITEANGRLLASPPDLLAALHRIADRQYTYYKDFVAEDQITRDDVEAIRAAIAKAEGGAA